MRSYSFHLNNQYPESKFCSISTQTHKHTNNFKNYPQTHKMFHKKMSNVTLITSIWPPNINIAPFAEESWKYHEYYSHWTPWSSSCNSHLKIEMHRPSLPCPVAPLVSSPHRQTQSTKMPQGSRAPTWALLDLGTPGAERPSRQHGIGPSTQTINTHT